MNESAARLVFPGSSPLGHQFTIGTAFGLKRGRAGGEVWAWWAILTTRSSIRSAVPTMYLSHDQYPGERFSVVVRAVRLQPH